MITAAVAVTIASASCTVASTAALPPYHPSAETTRAIEHAPSVSANLVLAGALSAHALSARRWGDCGDQTSSLGRQFSVFLLLTVPSGTYSLLVVINRYAGPKSYPIAESGDLRFAGRSFAIVSVGPFSTGADARSGQARLAGAVSVSAPDGTAGSLTAPDIPTSSWWPASQRSLSISGTWSCL